LDRDQILKSHEAMAQERQTHEGKLRELAEIFRPDDADWQSPEASTRDNEDLFDGTPQDALDTFVAGMFTGSIDPTTRWFELSVLEDPDLSQKSEPVKQHLWDRAQRIYSSLAPGTSAFYLNASVWLSTLGAYGMGAFYQAEEVGRQRIIDRAIPVGEAYWRYDYAGALARFDRSYFCKGEHVLEEFGEKWKAVILPDRTYQIVHAVAENDEYEPDRLGPKGMPWASYYCSPDAKDFETESAFHELPYHLATWDPRAKSPYPKGPGHKALADANMLQDMERTHLVAGQFQAEPIILSQSESAVSVADIVPRNVLFGTINDAGKQLVQTLEHKGALQLSMAMSEQRRQAIRNFFYFSIMRLIISRPQMTATEFLGFKEEELKQLSRHLVRVYGALGAFIARRDAILLRAGQYADLPVPPELAGRRLTIKYNSPLAKLVEIAEGRAILQGFAAIEQLAVTDPAARDWANGDAAAPRVLAAFSSAPGIIRDKRAVDEIRKARMAAQQQQIALEQMGQVAEIGATAAHAQQASSAATQRRLQ
jgi:head-to-tail connecting protein